MKQKTDKISKQIIWNYSQIENKQRTLCHKTWNEKGIKCISQIYNERTKTFYTFEMTQHSFNINNSDFLNYYEMIESITK